ncbi:hypothetical protein CSC80_01950 [Maribacter sp. 6B07]|uniref:hypothetical protein n=1 Tax=Maribacter sp. 6B07 TaxID=2045442 RepID=UPI000C076328|nr:hypothetical protein [Maribacter sp. 6B07]PHN94139.1 hypothetical protein CSC80_01950 [Maribacter sp. 6B07]
MKTIKFIVQVIALCVVLYSFTTTENYPYKNSVAKETIALISTDSVLGVWKYTMTNVDAPYEKGMFFITQKGDSYDVAVKLGTGMLTGQDVVVKDNGINFNVNFEGLKRVSFVLVVENDKIVGESYSAIGTSEIFGVRQLPGQ